MTKNWNQDSRALRSSKTSRSSNVCNLLLWMNLDLNFGLKLVFVRLILGSFG